MSNSTGAAITKRGIAWVSLLIGLLAWGVRGEITYTLHLGNSAPELEVSNSVKTAAALFNQYGSFNKHWNVYYNAGIPTAEANYDGYMGFGSQRSVRTAIHEAAHTLGMGTIPAYHNLIAGGVWRGVHGRQAALDTYNTYPDGLHGDGHAIWPGGMNYESEDGFIERIWSIRVLAAMRCDMGILAFSKEAQNELVAPGETAEFRVESPVATSFRWHRNGVALSNGGDFSGVTTATLRIANAVAADEGTYHCVIAGAGETLRSRPRQLWVRPKQTLAHLAMDGDVLDEQNNNSGTSFGSPAYVAGKIGQAIDLDGLNDYVQLPSAVGMARDITVAAWVQWDGGNNWQRVFDFGNGIYQNMFLTPKSASGRMVLAFKDAINATSAEKRITTAVLPAGQWVHVAAVLKNDYATLYVDGKAVGSVTDIGFSPVDFLPTQNYIGKSQYPDPLFNGRVDEFRIYNYALTGADVWSLWGQSANSAPVFAQDPIVLINATNSVSYSGQSLASSISDADGDALTVSKVGGPSWLSVAANGSLNGTPGFTDAGTNVFVVKVTDPSGASSHAEVRIHVVSPLATVVASGTAPITNADDRFYLAAGINESATINGNGSNSGANDESTYVAPDRSSKGQSFTTGANPGGYTLRSFTFQHVKWPAFANNGSFYDVQRGDLFEFQFGRISASVKTPLMSGLGTYSSAPIIGSGTSGSGQFLTFNLSILPLPKLLPNTTYYFQVASGAGDPYFELNSAAAANFAGGTAFRGSTADLGSITAPVSFLSGDFVFHAALTAITSDFEAWIAGYEVGEERGFAEDPDGDGLANGMENYLGTNPTAPNQAGLTAPALNGNIFVFQHPENPEKASDISASYVWSLDLNTWHDAGDTLGATTVNFTRAPNTPANGTTTVTGTIDGSVPPMIFTRLKLVQVQP